MCLNLVEIISNARVHTFIMYSSVVDVFRAGPEVCNVISNLKMRTFPLNHTSIF